MKLAKTGQVTFAEELCKGCELCIIACPKKIIFVTERLNQSGYPVVGVTEADKCTGCAMCYLMCPDLAIRVEREAVP